MVFTFTIQIRMHYLYLSTSKRKKVCFILENKHEVFSLVLLYLPNLISHLIHTGLIYSHEFFFNISSMSLFTVGHNTIVPLIFIAQTSISIIVILLALSVDDYAMVDYCILLYICWQWKIKCC